VGDRVVLSYCESTRFLYGWNETCIDAGTRELNLDTGAAD
jgi:hypothetical protein